MYYMLFCCGAIMLLSVIIGFRRGLLKSLLRVIAIIIAVVASFLLSPMVVNLLYENTDWDEQIEQQIYTKIESGIHSQVVDVLKDSGVKPEDIAEVAEKETRSIMENKRHYCQTNAPLLVLNIRKQRKRNQRGS